MQYMHNRKRLSKDRCIKEKEAVREMQRIGADPAGIKIMRDKAIFRLIRLTRVKPAMANIIKEGMLSAGGDAALHRLTCACKVECTDILLMGTLAQYKHLLNNLKRQPYGGKDIRKRAVELLKKSIPGLGGIV